MWISPGKESAMPQHTCPNCLSGVSAWDTTCPFCKADIPATGRQSGPVAAPRPPAAVAAPRSAPSTRSAPVTPPRRNSTLKALAISTVVLNVSTVIASSFLVIQPMVTMYREGMAPDQALAALFSDAGFLMRIQIMGVIVTVLSGFMAGWLGRERELFHAGMLGLISLLLGALGALAMPSSTHSLPVWYWLAGGILALPSALLGGQLAHLVRGRKAATDSGVSEGSRSRPTEPLVEVKALRVDRDGRYLYVPLIFALGCYFVPPELAESFDRDLRRYRWIALPALIFCAWPGVAPLDRLIRVTAAGSLICIGYLWRSRGLVPVTVDKDDLVRVSARG